MTHEPEPSASALLDDSSLEMTGKDVEKLRAAAGVIPAGTRINITFLGNEDLDMRVSASAAVARAGFVPVPHISARRLHSADELTEYLDRLREVGAIEHVFAVGGDPAEPLGPYPDSLTVIRSGLLQAAGVREVAVAGYPEGHPDIPEAVLWEHLEAKSAVLAEAGLGMVILTQFSFDAEAVAAWIRAVRSRGITAPIRIGVPGPTSVKRLLGYARRFGIGTSAGIVKKYGFSLTHLLGTAGPDRFVAALAGLLEEGSASSLASDGGVTSSGSASDGGASSAGDVGEVRLHMYTFGGLESSAAWVRDYRAAVT